MNCPIEQLPLLVYCDLAPSEAEAIQHHVSECAECQTALAELHQVRAGLSLLPMPEVIVDPAAVYLTSARQTHSVRWRHWAMAGGLAASLLALAFMKLEVRVDGQQLVVAWGQTTASAAKPADPANVINPRSIANLEERVQLLQELTHALARDVDRRDRLHTDEMIRTKAQVDALVQSSGQQIGETRRDVDALYAAHFKTADTGARP